MFRKLKEKWGVGWFGFILIFTTFALGGSLCARVGNWILMPMLTENGIWYWIVYVPLVSILWPVCVLVISIPLGQYRFFIKYLHKIGVKMGFLKG